VSTTRWDEAQLEAYLRKFKGENRAAVLSTYAEQTGCDAATPTDESKEVHSRFRVCISYRSKKLADPLGRSHKAAVDGLVRSGILLDDSSEHIEFAVPTEKKCERGEAEQTVIELWEITDAVHDETT
jgi:hypothetical protein